MRVVGLDPALRNFGMVAADLHASSSNWLIDVVDMSLVQTDGDGKQRVVRKSSENLRRGREVYTGLTSFLAQHNPSMVFVEVPSGAQSAAASMSLGLAVGILASITHPVIEVSPVEVKQLFAAKRAAVSKSTVMDWAFSGWPNAPWHRYKRAGKILGKNKVVKAVWNAGDYMQENEHLADALATIQAGISTPTFKQLLAMRDLHEVPVSHNNRHSSGGQPVRRVPVGAVPVDERADQPPRRKVLTNPW